MREKLSVGINIFLGVMTGMQPSNQKGLIWGRWQTQECGRAVETTAALIGLVEFHTGELWGVWTSGLWFVVSGGHQHCYTPKHSRTFGFSDTLSHRAAQLTRTWLSLPCCRRRSHIKSYAHISLGNHSRTCSPCHSDRDKTKKPSILLPHLHDLNCICTSLAFSTCLSGYRWMLFELHTRFLNKQNAQFFSDVFVVVHASFM